MQINANYHTVCAIFLKTLYKMLVVMHTNTQTFKKRIYYWVHVTKKYFKLRFKIFLQSNI